MMKPICVGREICGDPEAAGNLEWLETNGLGGFAASSIIGMNTRRYHGLLTAATRPPVGRVAMLSKLEETVTVGGRRYELGCNRYPGVVYPEGYQYLREFRLEAWPVFVYDLDGVTVEKRVFMVAGENTTVIEYSAGADCTLELRPLISFRDYHSTTHRNDALNAKYENEGGVVVLRPYGDLPALYLAHNAASVADGAGWYYNFEYDRERERGLDFREDLYNPVAMTFGVTGGGTAYGDRVDDAARGGRGGDAARAGDGAAGRGDRGGAGRRGVGAAVDGGGGSVPGAARRVEDGDRGLPVVQRLGARHDDLAAGAHAGDGVARDGAEDSAGVCGQHGTGDGAEPVSR